MKKKRFWIYHWEKEITAIGIILGLIALTLLIARSFNEPQFTIYKEECWNKFVTETQPIPIKLICAGIYPSDKDCIEKSKNNCIKNNGTIWYDDEFNMPYCMINISYDKQTCKKVEVDEIETNKWERIQTENCGVIECSNECVFRLDNKSTNPFRTPKTREECGIINQEFFYKDKISKKDLTKEWLEEQINLGNCEGLICNEEYGYFDGINPVCVKWIYYKCFDNYFIEVN